MDEIAVDESKQIKSANVGKKVPTTRASGTGYGWITHKEGNDTWIPNLCLSLRIPPQL